MTPSFRLIAFAILSILIIAIDSVAVPLELQLLKSEMNDMNLAGIQNDGLYYAKGNDLGIRNRPVTPRLRETESFTSYLNHDETDFHSETKIPLEFFSRLSKSKMEGAFYEKPEAKERIESALNSSYGSWYQMLMFQEPTLAQAGMNITNSWDTQLAAYQRDRTNEISQRRNLPEIAREVFDELERCVAEKTTGTTLGLPLGGLPLGGLLGDAGDYESAREYCESQISIIQFLAARNAIGSDNCEWSSLVMFGFMSPEVTLRMRAQFGDDELCPDASTSGTGGTLVSYKLKTIAPSFSTRQLWWDEYETAIYDLEDIMQQVRLENSGYKLSAADLARINIRPGVKISQALVTANVDGFDPLREQKELVHWWAAEKANAFIDFSCTEAMSALRDAASSSATPTEHARWKKRVDAVCGIRQEIATEMANVVGDEKVFSKIISAGSSATRRAAQNTVAQARDNQTRGRLGSQGTWAFGGMDPDVAEQSTN